MKKGIVCIAAIFAVLCFGGLNTADAWPYIEVEGFVNPYTGTVSNNGTTTRFGKVTYTFNVMTASPLSVDNPSTPWFDPWNPPVDLPSYMNGLSLEFEKDVFKSIGAVTFSDPDDWAYYMYEIAGSRYELGVAGETGTLLGVGDRLVFSVEDVVVYNAALVPGNKLWQEGDIWGQSWDADDTLGGNDGGSTTLVPEPGTLMLFGSGLAGLFYVRRSRVFNR